MKKLLITGGEGDIAKALKLELSAEFEIYLPNKEELDVTDIDSVKNFFSKTKFDIIVNAAGTLYSSVIDESIPELWIRDINVNLIGTYLVSKFAIQSNKNARIINLSSTAAFNSYKDWTSYCASKAGVNKLSMGMVKDGYDIIVLCPGAIETKLRLGLDIVNPNVMSIIEGIKPIKDAISGKYASGDVVFYRKDQIKLISSGDVL